MVFNGKMIFYGPPWREGIENGQKNVSKVSHFERSVQEILCGVAFLQVFYGEKAFLKSSMEIKPLWVICEEKIFP